MAAQPYVYFTRVSSNEKTGPIPVTTTEAKSCPAACPLKGNGCYADYGPLRMLWRQVGVPEADREGMPWEAFLGEIERLPLEIIWRHNQAGDLPHTRQKIDVEKSRQLIDANRGKHGFTYTHHDMAIPGNATIVAECNAGGFTVNLSANNLAHADALKALGIAPVAVVLPKDVHGNVKITTPAGNRVVVCPATYRKDVQCKSCGLCAIAKRDVIVGFPAHGTGKSKAERH